MRGLSIFIGSPPETYVESPGGNVNLRDFAGQVWWEGEKWPPGQPDGIQAEADKRQAGYDRVPDFGQGKSIAEVREQLEHEWRV
jgi:hypothetical protein